MNRWRIFLGVVLVVGGVMAAVAPIAAGIDKALSFLFGWALDFPVTLFIGGIVVGVMGLIVILSTADNVPQRTL